MVSAVDNIMVTIFNLLWARFRVRVKVNIRVWFRIMVSIRVYIIARIMVRFGVLIVINIRVWRLRLG